MFYKMTQSRTSHNSQRQPLKRQPFGRTLCAIKIKRGKMSEISLKNEIIEELDKLTTHEQGLVYKFIRTKLIANIKGVSLSNGGGVDFDSNQQTKFPIFELFQQWISCGERTVIQKNCVMLFIDWLKNKKHL